MPIVAASNGVKPFIRALGVIQLNKPVTPAEINEHVGTGDYAAKYISKLRKVGFVFTVQKDARNVVSYTLIAEPTLDAEKYRGMQPKQKAAKAPKAKAAKPVKAAPLPKHVVVRAAKPKRVDAVTKQFGTSGEVSSFGVDADWDSMEGVDVRSLVA